MSEQVKNVVEDPTLDIVLNVPDKNTIEPASDEIIETKEDVSLDTITEDVIEEDDISKENNSDITVELDGVQYNLDKDGNAINSKGEIVYNADEFSIEQLPSELEEFASLISSDLADIEDTAEFTPAYMAKQFEHLSNDKVSKAKEVALKEFFDANPDIEHIVKHKELYGTLDNYGTVVDYISLDIDSLKDEELFSLIIESEITRGATRERAERLAKLSISDKTLKEDAKAAYEYLSSIQRSEQERIKSKYDNDIREYRAQLDNINGVTYDKYGQAKDIGIKDSIYDDIINNNKIGDLHIPKSGVTIHTDSGKKVMNKKDLVEYTTKPVAEKDGVLYTKAELDLIDKLSNKKFCAALAILSMNGLDSLITEKANNIIKGKVAKKLNKINKASSAKTNLETGTKPTVVF